MSDPYIGEIRLFAGNFAPAGWASCQGQLIAIADNETLFALIGTTYGGDGENTYALPDLRGRVPIHVGTGPGLTQRLIGEQGGAETVTLTAAQLPPHTHTVAATAAPALATAGPGGVLATASVSIYGTTPPTIPMAAAAIAPAGGGQPHENMAPFMAMNYIIALFGIFPPRA